MKNKIKILFVIITPLNPYGSGVPRTTIKLGNYFDENNYDVYYFSFSIKGHNNITNGTLIAVEEGGRAGNKINLEKLANTTIEINPDIVINQFPYETGIRDTLFELKKSLNFKLLGCLRNSLFNVKDYMSLHLQHILPKKIHSLIDNKMMLSLFKLRHWIVHRKKLMDIIDKHDLFILLTPPNRWELNHFIGSYKPEKVTWIPNSIPYVLNPDTKKEKMILHVGNLNTLNKQSQLLIDFWEIAQKELPDWKFVIVGDGKYGETMKKDIELRKLKNIEMVGRQIPEPYYKNASIFIIPSAYEGFPNTILEAQSHGCVTLSFESYPAISWIINDKVDGFLSQPFDTDDMASKAITLAKDRDLLNKMKISSLKNSKRFTIDVVGKLWIDLFNDILEANESKNN